MNTSVKILLIRFSSIGDIVLTTAVIRCLKKQLEGEVEIHYLTKKIFEPLLKNNPYLSKIHCIEKSTNEVIEQLQSEQFDYVVDLHKNMRSSRVKKKLEGLYFTFEKLNIQKWILVNFKKNILPNVHIVDRYLDAVKALGIENDGEGLDYFIPTNIAGQIKIPDNFNPLKIGSNYTALVFGAAHFTKRIPKIKLIEIIEAHEGKFILIGGNNDTEVGEELSQTYPEKVWNACGKTTLDESAYLLQQSKTVISSDTGMMHISAALQKPIVSLWGNTVPEFGMYPYYKKGNEHLSTIFETKPLNCRPCSKIGFDKCPKAHFKCMLEIDGNKVADKL